MATHRISIFTVATLPGAGANFGFFEPFSVKATNDLIAKFVAIFNDTSTDLKIGFSFRVPKNYVGASKIVGIFASTAITGKYVFEVEYRAIAAGEAGRER